MKKAASKSVAQTAQSDNSILAALRQILNTDELSLFAACAAIEGKSVTEFTRHELRRTMFACYDCARENADNASNPDLIEAHAKLIPMVTRLGWLGKGSFPDKD
jgi:hypothetical protein